MRVINASIILTFILVYANVKDMITKKQIILF